MCVPDQLGVYIGLTLAVNLVVSSDFKAQKHYWSGSALSRTMRTFNIPTQMMNLWNQCAISHKQIRLPKPPP